MIFDTYNHSVKGKSQDPNAIRACTHCGEKFVAKNGAKCGRVWYCGYCHAAEFGASDPRWLPRLNRGEKLPPGFQRLR